MRVVLVIDWRILLTITAIVVYAVVLWRTRKRD